MKFALSLLLILASAHAADALKPNIVFIMADDAGIGDFGCYGSKDIATPNIDRLAAEGMRFTNAYSGNAVCAPTRDVVMTGRHPGHCLLRANKLLPLPPETVTVAEIMKSQGYATGGFGKWGLGQPGTVGVPEKQGFDVFFGYYDQVHAHNYFTDHLVRNSVSEKQPAGAYSHDTIEAETLKFIEAHKQKPFFLYVPWTLPHGNYVLPENDPALLPFKDKPWPAVARNYAAMVSKFDTSVGRLMAKLKETGIDDRTLVIFTSDNGTNQEFVAPMASSGGLRGTKRTLFEGGIRTPFIARWPGRIKAGSTNDLLAGHVDFLTTAADLAGAVPAGPQDGISMAPTLLGTAGQKIHPFLYWEIYESRFQQAVRSKDWKAYRAGLKAPIELYQLSEDRAESRNVAQAHPEIVAELAAIMDREHTPTPNWETPDYPSPVKKKKPGKAKDGKAKNGKG